jgi:hypothetical protein
MDGQESQFFEHGNRPGYMKPFFIGKKRAGDRVREFKNIKKFNNHKKIP